MHKSYDRKVTPDTDNLLNRIMMDSIISEADYIDVNHTSNQLDDKNHPNTPRCCSWKLWLIVTLIVVLVGVGVTLYFVLF